MTNPNVRKLDGNQLSYYEFSGDTIVHALRELADYMARPEFPPHLVSIQGDYIDPEAMDLRYGLNVVLDEVQ